MDFFFFPIAKEHHQIIFVFARDISSVCFRFDSLYFIPFAAAAVCCFLIMLNLHFEYTLSFLHTLNTSICVWCVPIFHDYIWIALGLLLLPLPLLLLFVSFMWQVQLLLTLLLVLGIVFINKSVCWSSIVYARAFEFQHKSALCVLDHLFLFRFHRVASIIMHSNELRTTNFSFFSFRFVKMAGKNGYTKLLILLIDFDHSNANNHCQFQSSKSLFSRFFFHFVFIFFRFVFFPLDFFFALLLTTWKSPRICKWTCIVISHTKIYIEKIVIVSVALLKIHVC